MFVVFSEYGLVVFVGRVVRWFVGWLWIPYWISTVVPVSVVPLRKIVVVVVVVVVVEHGPPFGAVFSILGIAKSIPPISVG